MSSWEQFKVSIINIRLARKTVINSEISEVTFGLGFEFSAEFVDVFGEFFVNDEKCDFFTDPLEVVC